MGVAHYFIAVSLKQPLKEQLSLWQKELKNQLAYKLWTHKQDLHITLKFLGAVPSNELQHLKSALDPIETMSSFKIEVDGLAYFGNPKKPRVLFADVIDSTNLVQLQKKTEDLAESCGFPKEKRAYRPHITLAKKVNGEGSHSIMEQLQRQYENKTMHMLVDEVVIYEIHPQKQPKYVPVATYRLEG